MAENISGRVRLSKGFNSQTESTIGGTLSITQGVLVFPDGTSQSTAATGGGSGTPGGSSGQVQYNNGGTFGGVPTLTYTGGLLKATGSFTGSFRGDGSGLTGVIGGSVNTGSLLLTASVALNTITFTKGDGSTFPITVNTGSGGGSTPTGSLLATASVSLNTITFTKGDGSTFPITVDTGSGGASTPTGSLLTTASFTTPNLTFTKGDSSTFNVNISSLTGSLIQSSQTSSMSVLSSSYALTSSFIPTANLTTLPTVVAFTAPVASITSGGSAAETTITTLTVPAGIFKSGDQILLTLWGNRTTGGPTGVNSTLTTRITDISGTTVIATTTGNRHHNYTLTGRCLSDTSIIWYQNSVTTAATTTTVPSLASSGFVLNFSVTRDLNTSEFTLYNAICRKYN